MSLYSPGGSWFEAALATMWTTGKLTPPPPRPIQIPESSACPATHLGEEDDATMQNPSQGSLAFDGSGELQPVSNQCYPREVVELDLETPTRLHSEPWYVKTMTSTRTWTCAPLKSDLSDCCSNPRPLLRKIS